MSIREIIKIPDPLLRKVCAPVQNVTDELRTQIDDMLDTMYKAPGIGLAAPQIGILNRVVVMDCSSDNENKNPIFLVNPEIISTSDEISVYNEGCLSIPDFYEDVERPAMCVVAYVDYDGEPREVTFSGLESTCIQHEIDHLDGKLFIDYISKLKRDRVIKKFTKLAKSSSVS